MAQSLKRNGWAILIIFVSWIVPASAQQSTYSADSLMAAFEKGSKNALKGSEITFSDTVVESKKSRVVFKSSGKDKIICELVSPLNEASGLAYVGSPLTVVGTVRGRGMLGNVTLDRCELAATAEAKSSPDVIEEETVIAEVPEPQPEEPPAKASSSVAVPVSRRPVPSPVAPSEPAEPSTPSSVAAAQPEQQSQTLEDHTISGDHPVYAFYTSVAVLVVIAIFASAKLGMAIKARAFPVSPDAASTPEMRRVALEALLLGRKRKRWRVGRL